MNNQTTATVHFDAWVSQQYNRLKQRIMTTCVYDDDAFQETYLTMREAVTPAIGDGDFEAMFVKLYKQMLAREFRNECRYAHPDPLFFLYLRTEPIDDTEATEMTPRQEVTAKQVDEFVRYNFSAGDYMIFHLKFFTAMTYKGLIDYTGHSSATIARKLNNIKLAINQRFTSPPPKKIASRFYSA